MPPRETFFARPFVWPSIILSVALVLGLAIVGWGIAARNQNNVITATGSASVSARADEAKWTVDVRRTVSEGAIPAAYSQIKQDAALVAQYFTAQHLASSSVTLSTIYTDMNYSPNQNAPTTYNVHETVTFETSDVDQVDALSRNLGELNGKVSPGTIVSAQPPEYYISTLPQLRVSLIGKAVADAKARAVEIAKSGGSSIGAIQSASSGVVQVLAPNSINISDYGSYDTMTIDKEVMVTTHATFYVR